MSEIPCGFATILDSHEQLSAVKLLVDSLRIYGGSLAACPVWIIDPNQLENDEALFGVGVKIIPLMVPQTTRHFIFASLVAACTQAEELASNRVDFLVWIDPECLIVNPPSLFKLGPDLDAAIRPVHIKSIGLLKDEPLNGYWERIYHLTDRRDPGMLVETFVDRQQIRAYFNSHDFAINPTLGVPREWAGLLRPWFRMKLSKKQPASHSSARSFSFRRC